MDRKLDLILLNTSQNTSENVLIQAKQALPSKHAGLIKQMPRQVSEQSDLLGKFGGMRLNDSPRIEAETFNQSPERTYQGYARPSQAIPDVNAASQPRAQANQRFQADFNAAPAIKSWADRALPAALSITALPIKEAPIERFKQSDIGYFDPRLDSSLGLGDMILVGQDIYYRDVFLFTELARLLYSQRAITNKASGLAVLR